MQYNIYFRKDNWDLFEKEEKKSDLINRLLTSHYGLEPGGVVGREYPKVQTKIEAKNIKLNRDGTLSPKDPTKPSLMTACPHGFGKGNCKFEDCNRKYRND